MVQGGNRETSRKRVISTIPQKRRRKRLGESKEATKRGIFRGNPGDEYAGKS